MTFMGDNIRHRDGVSKISELFPIDEKGRYDFFQMNGIFETALGYHTRGCEEELAKNGFIIPDCKHNFERLTYCDFWHYQLDAVFRNTLRNDSNNSIYVGVPDGINYKKLKKSPNDWQKMMLEKWNVLFSPFADKNGWVKVHITW